MSAANKIPLWTWIVPLLGLAALTLGAPVNPWITVAVAVLLGGVVLAAVHHAETIARQLGEPFGTLVLALAVTVIETSLIVSIMLTDSESAQTLARDTVFAAMMIVMNGIIGLCLLIGGGRHHEQGFTQFGVSAGLAMLSTLMVLTLVLPNYTVSVPGPAYSHTQLVFVAIVSIVIYGAFVVAQTIRHRDYFLYEPVEGPGESHGGILSRSILAASGALMVAALIGVVLLAKSLSPSIKAGVKAIGAPQAMVGVIIALLVLLPEGLSAVRAARGDRLQTSLNLAIGSALATIGLTIPAVAAVSLLLGLDLVLGLSPVEITMLVLTMFVASLSLGTGRTTFVQGVIHLVLFATFLFTTLVP